MHNALNRVQNVFGFFTTVASLVALAIALISLVSMPTPNLKDGSLKLRNVQVYVVNARASPKSPSTPANNASNSVKGRPHYYSQKKEEYAHIKFDLDVGMSVCSHCPYLPLPHSRRPN